MTESERERIGRRIASLRQERQMTLEDLAVASGLKYSHIVRIERGRYSVGIDELAAIATGLGCTLDFIENERP
jgi:transcriptional regulator with XRE-family HTH domain